MSEAWLGRFLAIFALALVVVIADAALSGEEATEPERAAIPAAPPAAVDCDRFAAPGGDDSAAGSFAAPFATAQRVADALAPGETGCLRAGTYAGVEIEPEDRPGYAETKLVTPNTTLASFPGERARLENRLWIAGSGITVANLDLVGVNPAAYVASSLTIGGDRDTPGIEGVRVVGNDISNDNQRICISLGATDYGRPSGTVIEANRIHDCGVYEYPPDATDPPPGREFTGHWNEDHGVYVGLADDTLIRRNLIYDNASRGVQLYPDAQRTRVVGNVIDNNGEGVGIGGDGADASSGNVIERNVITASSERFNVEHSFDDCGEVDGAACPLGNMVVANCLAADNRAPDYVPGLEPDRPELRAFYESNGGILDPGANPNTYLAPIATSDPAHNVILEPATDPYLNRAVKDFRLDPDSACAGTVGTDPAAGLDRWTAPATLAPALAVEDLGVAFAADGTMQASWTEVVAGARLARIATWAPARPSMATPETAGWAVASARGGEVRARRRAEVGDTRIVVRSELDPRLGYERIEATVSDGGAKGRTQTLSAGAVASAPLPAVDPAVAIGPGGTALVAWVVPGAIEFAIRHP